MDAQIGFVNVKDVADILDMVNLMTYDFYSLAWSNG
jgi:GH18 family chitinase